MATKLRNLRITNVDFVDKGANPGARIALYKRDSTPEQGGENQEKRMAEDTKETPPAELPEDVQKRLDEVEALAKRATDAEQREKALIERVAKIEETREREVCIRKAAELSAIGKADDLGSILYDVKRAVTPETYAKFETMLASAAKLVKAGQAFTEIGGGSDGEAGPVDRLDAMAKELVSKRDGLTYERAYAEILKTAAGRAAYAEIAKSSANGRA